MITDHTDKTDLVNEEQRDLTLIATVVGIIIVAGGFFILNSTTAQYTTASYRAPVSDTIPVMTPTTVPVPNTVPTQ